MMWDIALMMFCLITKQESLSWSVGLNIPHIFMRSALTKARIWTKNPQPSRSFSCISSLKKQFSFFSLRVSALGMCLAFFSPTNTKLQVSSGLFALCQAPGKPCGRCAMHRGSAMCLSFGQELLCFQFPDSTGAFVQVFCVYLKEESWFPTNFHEIPQKRSSFQLSGTLAPGIWMVTSFWGCITLFRTLF